MSDKKAAKLSDKKNDNYGSTMDTLENYHQDCPLGIEELGRCTWSLLHSIAARYPDKPTTEEQCDIQQFIRLLPKVYPSKICADDFAEILIDHPPDTSCQNSLAIWMCRVHNMVNKKLKKPLFDCSRVSERWRDGWRDGHCK